MDPVIYHDRCIVCGNADEGKFLCRRCKSEIHYLKGSLTAPVHKNYSRLFSVAAYEGPMLGIVHALKYAKARTAIDVVRELLSVKVTVPDADRIVPVPLHWWRYVRRGYNQSVLIADELSRVKGIPVLRRALVKRKRTSPQVGKDLAERKLALRGVFGNPRLFADRVRGLKILLVDDVITSGATVDECAKALSRAGAVSVDVFTLAKTL